MSILIVEDSETMLCLIRESLKSFGVKKIKIAKNGIAALEIIKTMLLLSDQQFLFDCIICDWLLPGDISGLDILKSIRSNPETNKIPFIMLTSVKNREMITKAIASGVSAYILKPFTPESLYDKIESLVNKEKRNG